MQGGRVMSRPPAMLAILLAAVLASACVSGGRPPPAAWDEVAALAAADERGAAAARLRSRGAQGLSLLLDAARLVGPERVLWAAAVDVGLVHTPAFAELRSSLDAAVPGDEGAGVQAGRLALAWLSEQPRLALAQADADHWLARALAAIALRDSPAAIERYAEALAAESDRRVVAALAAALEQAGRRAPAAARAGLRRAKQKNVLAERWDAARCAAEPAGLQRLAAGVRDGRLRRGGYGVRDGAVFVALENRSGRRIELAPACALALHDALAAAGTPPPWLIEPLLQIPVLEPELLLAARKRARALAAKLDGQARNRLLARVVNAGGRVAQQLSLPEDGWGLDEVAVLEAVARQDARRAIPAIRRLLLCRGVFGAQELIALLGFVDAPDAAERAWAIGRSCEHALEPAIIALLRLGDPRAVELLDRRLDKSFPPVANALILALRAHRSPELEAHLAERAAAGNDQAQRILYYLDHGAGDREQQRPRS